MNNLYYFVTKNCTVDVTTSRHIIRKILNSVDEHDEIL